MSFFSRCSQDDFVSLITTHQSDLAAYIGSLLPGDPAVGDILQRTNLVLWRKRNSFEKGTNFLAWAFSVARWEVRAHLKECKRRSWLVVDDDLARMLSDTAEEDVGEMPYMELRGNLEKCIAKLKPREQELITHRYYTDAPLSEYAHSLGQPVASIKTSLMRIRASLKRCIEFSLQLDQINTGGQS